MPTKIGERLLDCKPETYCRWNAWIKESKRSP